MNPDLYVVFQDEINVIRILIAFQGRSLEFIFGAVQGQSSACGSVTASYLC